MPKQVINIGAAPNDTTGDKLRVGGAKINANFTELYGKILASLAWNSATSTLTATLADATAVAVVLPNLSTPPKVVTSASAVALTPLQDATVFMDATASAGVSNLPLISSIPAGQTRLFTLKKTDASINGVSYICAATNTIEQRSSAPIAFAASLTWNDNAAITIISDTTNNRWLIV